MKQPIHVVALKASPEAISNSDTMLEAFLDGMRLYDEIVITKFDINQIPMRHYAYEVKRPPAHETEFIALVEKLQQSQGLVIATPTYNFSVPSNLKNFIDRMSYAALDYQNLNIVGQPSGRLKYLKPFFIVSGGSPALIEKLLFFVFPIFWLRIIFLYFGAPLGGGLYGGGLSFTKPARNRNLLLTYCRYRGQRYAHKLIRAAR